MSEAQGPEAGDPDAAGRDAGDGEAGGDAGDAAEGRGRRGGGFRRAAKWTGIGVLGLFLVIQLVPYGWRHSNPPVVRDAPWPDAESEAIAHRSCYSCHSNETDWPQYSYVAPMSWLVHYDVYRGRKKFNFSDWDRYSGKAGKAVDFVLAGTMPKSRYTLIHSDAKLSTDDVTKLSTALGQMSQDSSGSGGGGGGGDDSGGDDGGGDDSGG